MPQPPVLLTDYKRLAPAIYDHWIRSMITDRVIEENQLADWAQMPNGYKENFIEAMRIWVCDPLSKFFMRSQTEAESVEMLYKWMTDEAGSLPPEEGERAYACYVCSGQPVSLPGKVCKECKKR